ncbi:hypothetical protein RSOLAG1IB_11646 [Rhizoctonia solani AG-1 IB]|uniref:Nephrocystin 3-like N-terminal domain-containing protein n=1 Tax=Thanatephorus cucumeris (strain AG1-IB / isolate 7/3/14) TaxID=1108050 RepID=A0A0B7FA20_THACB|nr:hypothetical protein RSOLAG1IB_11646 [Rhizoctonia solani AG-1 IB]
MASQPPPETSGGHGFRAAMRSRLQRAKDSLTPSSRGSPLPENSDSVNKSSFKKLFPNSQSAASLLIHEHKVPQLTDAIHQNATSSTPELPSTPNDSTHDAGTIGANPQKMFGSTSWNKLATSLRALEAVTDLFPPLKAAVGSFIGCLDMVQSAALNRKDYEQLADKLTTMANSINQYGQELDSETSNGSIANIARCIEDQVAWIKHKDERGAMSRIRDATEDRDNVIRCYRQIGVLFRRLQCNVTMRTRSDVKKQLEITLLRGISPVDDAMYNSSYSTAIRRHGCTAETRKSTQKTLQTWATDPNGAKIYWMNGMAGTGKTTIAYSFCQWLENNHRLGASFFCSRISSTCRSLNRIVPTIAYLLALYSPGFWSKLCAALKENPNAGVLNVLQQFKKLIHQPMSSPVKNLKPGETLPASKSEEISMNLKTKDVIPDGVVIVIDALDECDDGYSVRLLLDVLFKFAACHDPFLLWSGS